MDVTPVIPKGRQVITGYGADNIVINGVRYSSSVLVFADEVLEWSVTHIEQVNETSFSPVIERASAIELLLLGTGARMVPLLPSLREFLKRHGVAVEVMDTGAACRTYNVLLSEERRVAAALIAYPATKE